MLYNYIQDIDAAGVIDQQRLSVVVRGGSLVYSTPFVRRIAVSKPALATTYRDFGQVLHSQLPVALRHEIPTQYPCCVGGVSE